MGTLYVVATPIGNLEDITVRATKILLSTPIIVCEDTRHTGQLIKILEERYPDFVGNTLSDPPLNLRGGSKGELFSRRYISVRDWNEAEMVPKVLVELQDNDVALVSDAGTPLISDPGFKVVRAAREAGFKIVPVPGANAAIVALSASGLPTNKFVFLGFLGKKWKLLPGYTHIIYESPNRTDGTCMTIRTKYHEVKMVVTQELTKIHESIEEYREGMKFKGEVTILAWLPEQVSAHHGNGDGDIHKR